MAGRDGSKLDFCLHAWIWLFPLLLCSCYYNTGPTVVSKGDRRAGSEGFWLACGGDPRVLGRTKGWGWLCRGAVVYPRRDSLLLLGMEIQGEISLY